MTKEEVIKKVRKIEIKSRRICGQLFTGEFHRAFKGHGLSFSEVREYQEGDEIRTIDWNVTARLNHPFVKIFEEERESNIVLLIDASSSMFFGTKRSQKYDLIIEIAAVLAFSALQNHDKVGAMIFTNRMEHFLSPKKDRSNVLRMISELIQFNAQRVGTDLGSALHFLNHAMKKPCIVFILSDFITFNYEFELHIAAKKHDVIALHIFDEREKILPNAGLLQVTDPETGQVLLLDTSSKVIRSRYEEEFMKKVDELKNTLLQCNADWLSIGTGDDYIHTLLSFFKLRSVRE